jgi:hypothetical protein
MLTEEHYDWNDRIEKLIRGIIDRVSELRDLLTISRFLAWQEIVPVGPQLRHRLKENQ